MSSGETKRCACCEDPLFEDRLKYGKDFYCSLDCIKKASGKEFFTIVFDGHEFFNSSEESRVRYYPKNRFR